MIEFKPMKLRFFIFVCLLGARAFAQNLVSADFDGDKLTDQARLMTNNDGFRVACALSGAGNSKTALITSGGQENTLTVSKNVLILTCQFMRGVLTYRFRYDPVLKQIKLIGYDNEQFGTGTGDGAGSSSYNLLTGTYKSQWNYFSKTKKELLTARPVIVKLPSKTYLLKDFSDEITDQLSQLDYSLLPKELK